MKKYFAFASILIVGLALRLYHNLDVSLWHDEAFSALLIKYPWHEMLYRIGLDVHPPVYYIALRLWHYVFGDSLLSLRGFSVWFGLFTAVGAYAFVKQAFGNQKAAIIAFLLIALNPFQIQYALEARMYTFGAFLSVLAAYFLVRAHNRTLKSKVDGSKTQNIWMWYGLFGITAGLASLTHYYLLFTVAALCFYAFCFTAYTFRTQLKSYLPLLFGYVIAAGIFLTYIKTFLFQYKQVGAGYWIPALDKWSIPTTLWQMLLGIGIDIHKRPTQVMVVLCTLFSIYFLVQFIRKTTSPHKWLVLLVFLAPFGGSLAFALLAKLKGGSSSVYLIRYFLFASTFYLIALSVWLANLSRAKLIYGLVGLYALVNLGTFAHYWQDMRIITRSGMAGAVRYLQSHSKPNDKLYVGSSFEFFNLKYYLTQAAPPVGPVQLPKTMSSKSFSLEDLSDDAPRPTAGNTTPLQIAAWPKPLLFSGGNTSVHNLPHFAGTAILIDSDLLPHFEQGATTGDTVWLLWTTGFGGSKPTVPSKWSETDEAGFEDIHPYPGTWIVVTRYLVK